MTGAAYLIDGGTRARRTRYVIPVICPPLTVST